MNYDNEKVKELCVGIHEEFKNRRLIQKSWPTTDEIFYSEYIHRLLKIAEMIPEICRRKGAKVLDVGCGEGRLALLLKDLGYDVSGVDAHVFEGLNTFDEPRGPLLSKYFSKKGIHVEKTNIENEKLPFSDKSFEMVMFMEVIEHLYNSPKPVLQEINRVLKSGGYLLLSAPNYASLKKRLNAIQGKSYHWPLKGYYNFEFTVPPSRDYVGHTREFTLPEIEAMLKWEGFEIISAKTYSLPNGKGLSLKELPKYWLSRKGTGLVALTIYLLQNMGKRLKECIFVVARKP